MIEGITNKTKYRSYVTRVCDNCGKKDKKTYGEIIDSKSRKKLGKDYCKKCAYKFRKLDHPEGINSSSWTGGVSINKTSGYLRINKTGVYLHKQIYSDFIGRTLTAIEQVHHTDMNKLNNDLDNLWLCNNKSEHHFIHSQMEQLAISLLNKYVWFSKKEKIYKTIKTYNEHIPSITLPSPTCICTGRKQRKYAYIYLGNRKHIAYHRYVMEKTLKRKLSKYECVHHIDDNPLNNDCNNLIILSRSEHTLSHESLQKCVAFWYTENKIKFTNGKYYVK
jgi:hypothetical protein